MEIHEGKAGMVVAQRRCIRLLLEFDGLQEDKRGSGVILCDLSVQVEKRWSPNL